MINKGKITWIRWINFPLAALLLGLFIAPATRATASDELDQSRKKYMDWVIGPNLDYEAAPVKQRYNALKSYISRAHRNYADYDYANPGAAYDLNNSTDYDELKDIFQSVILPLSVSYHLAGPTSDPNPDFHNAEVLNKILNVFNYMHARGWKKGIVIPLKDGVTLDDDINVYVPFSNSILMRSAGYAHSVLIMRDALKTAGLLARELETLDWTTRLLTPPDQPWAFTHTGFNTDGVRTIAIHRLLYVLAQDATDSTRVNNIQALVDFLENALSLANGWADMIKPDYLGYHHKIAYGSAYVPQALHCAALTAYLLQGTPFSLPEQTLENIKKSLLAHRLIANKYDIHDGVTGRFPDNLDGLAKHLPAYAYMALATEPIDTEMAAAFMRLWQPGYSSVQSKLFKQVKSTISYFHTMGSLDIMLQLAQQGIAAEPDPAGHWVKPYAAMSIHRRDDWMVAVKGYSKYMLSYEQSDDENVYGRYFSYGFMKILSQGNPVNSEASGFIEDGWDWKRLPGVTAINVPLSQLKGDEPHGDRKFTDQSFAGGVSLSGKHGVFAMKHFDVNSNSQMRANKSMFFFDNQIVCLGSNIINGSSFNQTETTLFQSHLASRTTPNNVDAQEITAFPYDYAADGSEAIWLTDPVGNGYYLPNREGVHVLRSTQESRDNGDKGTTRENFATAWIDHGKKLENAAYEYVVLVKSTPEEVQDFAQNASAQYTVLQRDSSAHIVRHEQLGLTGYALFQAHASLEVEGDLQATDTPSLVMTKSEPGKLTVSVCNPDFGWLAEDQFIVFDNLSKNNNLELLNTPSKVLPVQITLKGVWRLDSQADNVRILESDSDKTVVQFDCFDAQSVEAQLVGQTTGVVDDSKSIPENYISTNYPNPFNPATTIEYSVQQSGFVSIKIYAVNGRLVQILVAEKKHAGQHTAVWDGKNVNGKTVSSGSYFYQIKGDSFTATKKMLFIK